MALIEGEGGKLLGPIDSTCLGMPVVIKRRDAGSAYIGTFRTSTLPAALASNSILAGMRNGPNSTKRAYITQINVEMVAITAATAAAACSIDLVRYSVANLQQQGTLLTTLGIMRRDPFGAAILGVPYESVFTPAYVDGGQLTVATTSGLTSAGVTIDSAQSPFFFFNTTTTTPAILERITLNTWNELGMEHPIELGPGEGLAFRTSTAFPTSFSAVVLIRVHWLEV